MGRYYIKILLGSSLLLVSKLSLAQTAKLYQDINLP